MKLSSIFFPVAGVLTLLWNGHVFSSNYSTFTFWAAVGTTIIWLVLFTKAYGDAE